MTRENEPMPWTVTHSRDEFEAAAGAYLHADPAVNTVPLTVLAALREAGPAAYGDEEPVFGWHLSAAGATDGAFLQTPPYPVLVAGLPGEATADLVRLIADRGATGANLPGHAEAAFGAAWTSATGGASQVRRRSRLFRLDGLVPPEPFPPGEPRLAGQTDFDLLVRWASAFAAEANLHGDPVRDITDKLSYGAITLWESGGEPVAIAGLSRSVAGVVRVVLVYTPPEHRRRGYGGAATTAVSQRALAAGAAQVVLYTDLANPTSNALYQSLGYRPVCDRVELDLER
jgi:RimJ/RimL family protein N-acetyltransferase